MEIYINGGIDGYILPSNPCGFDNINMTWIFSQVDPSILDLVTDNSYFSTIPCQLLVQLPWLLDERDINYLIDQDYWFGDDGQCDIVNTENNVYNITICEYELIQVNNNSNLNETKETFDECPNDDRCYYPFVLTKYKSDDLKQFGMCHCQESCQFRFYGGNIEILDIYNQCCLWISLLLIIGYFLNLYMELKNIREQRQRIIDLPFTFDIPFFCASALFLLTLCQLLPYLVGKDYFSCETGTLATIRGKDLPKSSYSCFIQGSIIYISIITVYTYFVVLSFCVWRYLHRPLKPLFGIHKKWWHFAIWIYILGLFCLSVFFPIFAFLYINLYTL